MISEHPNEDDVRRMIAHNEAETDPEILKYYRAYWEISNKVTGEILEDIKGRNPEMARTLMDLLI